MLQILLIGLGAGAASALLFAALASGKFFAIGLFYLTPLPILLAGVAWSHLAGLIAAAAAATILGFTLGRWFFLTFMIGIGLPSYALSYLALLARPVANGSGDKLEWFSAGRLVLAAALIAAAATACTIPALGSDLDSYRAALKFAFERILRAQSGTPEGEAWKLPGGGDPRAVLDFLAVAMPLAAAVFSMITSLANLWLAARIARAASRLKRPWPALPAMTFPHATPFLLIGAIVFSFLPGLAGLVASLFAATLLMAYVILGFCIIHGATRDFAVRAPTLAAIWISVLFFGWPILLVAIIGLADGFADFRGRLAPPAPPNLPTRKPPNE